ncbi:F-box/LRR-repeat protein 12 [Rhodamnia argentea]|uniref:F-box/LRR-repeat protein 12 n=1 Tax=Rhodamnia argentea TaxID=178133 RepID=A0A8B8R474_9MYRT|nr:F-box/LRR-repeat protein 12 [Rhodamnia argentea]XP_030553282.2 F-box/LRR-repeat protein 12 [Rhodamnia argentea]
MEDLSGNHTTSIVHLPDDCLIYIFQRLKSSSDRASFGLTCLRWLHIENVCRRSLQFDCSFTLLKLSLSQPHLDVKSFHLDRLLARFQHLQSLSLSGCTELPDSGLTPLRSYGSNIRSLHLDCCFGITDHGLSAVTAGCQSLTVISLYRCNITDVGLETLASGCPDLEKVNLTYCPLISDRGLRALSQGCHNLRAIKISHCGDVTGVGIRGCSPTLIHVDAESCKLDAEGISGIVSGGGLEYLNIGNVNWRVGHDSFVAIGSGFAQRLRILNLRLCRSIGDESVAAIARGCPLLQEWSLALCHGVRTPGWQAIGLHCNYLEKLHANRCRNLCDEGLEALRRGCNKLTVLYIGRGSPVSAVAIEMFKMQRSSVQIKDEEAMCLAPERSASW